MFIQKINKKKKKRHNSVQYKNITIYIILYLQYSKTFVITDVQMLHSNIRIRISKYEMQSYYLPIHFHFNVIYYIIII